MLVTQPLMAAAVAFLPMTPVGTLPSADPEYRFSRAMRAGQTLAIANIDGAVTVTRAAGGTAEVVVTKRVIRGDGELVRAILEESGDQITVCTIYLREATERRDRCHGESNHDGWRRREPLEVEMTYEVRLPAGVELSVAAVDGDVTVTGLAAPARITTVDGSVRVTGRAPDRITTVDGDIELVAEGSLPGEMRLNTVDGSVVLRLPEGSGFEVHASTLDGALESDFPLTVQGRWGPRSLRGRVGDGRTAIRVSTVDGDVMIRRR
jgi:hypothetical protein